MPAGRAHSACVLQAVGEVFPRFKNDQVLQMAYQVTDEGGDGWIGLREFRSLLRHVAYLEPKWNSYIEIQDAAGEKLSLHHVMAGST